MGGDEIFLIWQEIVKGGIVITLMAIAIRYFYIVNKEQKLEIKDLQKESKIEAQKNVELLIKVVSVLEAVDKGQSEKLYPLLSEINSRVENIQYKLKIDYEPPRPKR